MMRSMMMMHFHMSMALELMALSFGVIILVWSMQENLRGKKVAMVFGYIITILASISLLCSIYYGLKFWEDSLSRPDMPMMVNGSQPNAMMPLQPAAQSKAVSHEKKHKVKAQAPAAAPASIPAPANSSAQ